MGSTWLILSNDERIEETDKAIENIEGDTITYMSTNGFSRVRKTATIIKRMTVDKWYIITKPGLFKKKIEVKWNGRFRGLGYGEFIDKKGYSISALFSNVEEM